MPIQMSGTICVTTGQAASHLEPPLAEFYEAPLVLTIRGPASTLWTQETWANLLVQAAAQVLGPGWRRELMAAIDRA